MDFPFPEPPPPGRWTEVAPGLLWARLALPFRLDHVNVYALEDSSGWVILDTGIADEASRAAWDALLPALGPVGAVLVTHHHPDHIGLAGWLCERLSVPLWTSRTAFLSATALAHAPGLLEAEEYGRLYAAHGMPPALADRVRTLGHAYLRRLTLPPRTYRRLSAGMRLRLGGRDWSVLSADGHAPEQILLHAPADGLLIAADQVIERISPNVSASAFEPEGDPVGEFRAGLAMLGREVGEGALVLPGHRRPFRGLHERIAELDRHHEARCDLIRAACAERPRTAAELLPVVFPRPLDPHKTGFAVGEVIAHANHLVARGLLRWEESGGLRRLAA
ncbi:MBL fold metallo-hydrolase [Rubellimicrobium sp. CFH 75288]|uniref:MBL fold metallo-hydrolase n=1 Tax=Rubellimicrobium sp. CFH 75288 TaxID=2697034 RepID=UPI0014120568|nr:MBL fold metallo-hydrolase [Rubellimicrobium sp. CFH 75288]NAZ36538.1 MBL fold metallo-hydrolase [Rubellimicrobium sp. CFH 75288]